MHRFDGPAFRAARQHRGLALIDVVTHTGRCTYRHVQQFETGRRHISVELAHRLAAAITTLSGQPYTVAEFTRDERHAA